MVKLSIPEKYQSKKFITAIVTVVAIVSGQIPEAQVGVVVNFLMVYLGGQSVVDVAAAARKK